MAPISFYIIFRKLRDAKEKKAEAGDPIGFVLLIPALLLHLIDTSLWFQILSAISLIPALLGIFLLFLGRSRTLEVCFPILLLGFMIPVPSVVSQPVLTFLRHLSAIGTEMLIQAANRPVLRMGTVLELPTASINIGDPCSGFATLSATLLFTGIILYLWYPGRGRVLLMVGLSFIVAVFANILRCTMLSFLVMEYDVDILHTFLHPLSGYLTYAIAIGLQSVFLWTFKRNNS